MSVSSKMAVVGGRVIRYVKATFSMFFINLLLKDISSTKSEQTFLAIFQCFYWLMASSGRQLPVTVDQ